MEASDVQVRRAHPDEWATVRDVRLAALADAPDAFASTLSCELARTEPQWRSRIGTWPWFLAWRSGTPAGLVAAVPDQPASGPPAADPPARDPRGWHLVSMWVSPQVRGTGVAELLVSAIVDHAYAVGAPRITLWRRCAGRGGTRPPGQIRSTAHSATVVRTSPAGTVSSPRRVNSPRSVW
jgi:GNAT superfamily N-acetyltransferase